MVNTRTISEVAMHAEMWRDSQKFVGIWRALKENAKQITIKMMLYEYIIT